MATAEYTIEQPGDSDHLTTTIVGAVADAEGVHPLELDCLHDVVDVEAIGALLGYRAHDAEPVVEFTYEGHGVRVRAPETVEITDRAVESGCDGAEREGTVAGTGEPVGE